MKRLLLAGVLSLAAFGAYGAGMFEGFPNLSPLVGNEKIPADTNLSGGRQPQTVTVTPDTLKNYVFGNTAFGTATATGTGAAGTATITTGRGKITTGAIAAVPAQVITITATGLVTTNSIVLASVDTGTGTTVANTTTVKPTANTIAITLSANDNSTNLNGTYIVSYVIIN